MKNFDIKNFDSETVCEKLLDMVQDMDYHDYDETLEQGQKLIKRGVKHE
jgi:hypothetical protein